jgi:hypothetical protein
MLWPFTYLLQVRLSTRVSAKQQRILLVDATYLAEIGPKRDNWSLHFAYELEIGQFCWVQVTDQHTGKGFAHLLIQPQISWSGTEPTAGQPS